ncbi:MAG: hypothetical protein ACYC6F_14395 [Longimicrobiales bacterium]
MRRFGTSAIPFLVVMLHMIGGAGSATGQAPAVAGTYELDQQNSDDVKVAIREATEGAGFFVRNVGRRLLAEKLRPIPLLRIVLTDSAASITGDDGSPLVTPLAPGKGGGEPLRQGEDVTTRWDGRDLVRVFREDGGVRQYRYSLDEDGRTLRVKIRVEGSKLPRPVEYVLTYGRRSPAPQ